MPFAQSLVVLFAVFAHFGLSAVVADSRVGGLNDPKRYGTEFYTIR